MSCSTNRVNRGRAELQIGCAAETGWAVSPARGKRSRGFARAGGHGVFAVEGFGDEILCTARHRAARVKKLCEAVASERRAVALQCQQQEGTTGRAEMGVVSDVTHCCSSSVASSQACGDSERLGSRIGPSIVSRRGPGRVPLASTNSSTTALRRDARGERLRPGVLWILAAALCETCKTPRPAHSNCQCGRP